MMRVGPIVYTDKESELFASDGCIGGDEGEYWALGDTCLYRDQPHNSQPKWDRMHIAERTDLLPSRRQLKTRDEVLIRSLDFEVSGTTEGDCWDSGAAMKGMAYSDGSEYEQQYCDQAALSRWCPRRGRLDGER